MKGGLQPPYSYALACCQWTRAAAGGLRVLVVSLPAGRSSALARTMSSPRVVLVAAGSSLSDCITVTVQIARLV